MSFTPNNILQRAEAFNFYEVHLIKLFFYESFFLCSLLEIIVGPKVTEKYPIFF